MPKLDSKTAAATDETEAVHGGGEFEPLEPGKYLARLSTTEVTDNKNKFDAAMWSAEFEEIHSLDGEKQPGRQWLNLTIPTTDKPHPKYENGPDKWVKYQNMLRGRLKAFFEAFGYTTDSDTDELAGEWAVITLTVETIQQGAKAGQKTNRVVDIEAVPDDFEAPSSDDDDNDKF